LADGILERANITFARHEKKTAAEPTLMSAVYQDPPTDPAGGAQLQLVAKK